MNHPNRSAKAKLFSLVSWRELSTVHPDRIEIAASFESLDPNIRNLVNRYVEKLSLPLENLDITTDRREYERWLGRRIAPSIGGAYVYLSKSKRHAILINLPRIDSGKPRSLELVVAEELIHMRDYLDGDRRRHAKHGYDRIALKVAELTGATLDEIRSCLLPAKRRPLRYHYSCPNCGLTVARRKRGTWSCGRCSPQFERELVLKLVRELGTEHAENK
jgi:predicted SprT family Zn-dependent metalloprotease